MGSGNTPAALAADRAAATRIRAAATRGDWAMESLNACTAFGAGIGEVVINRWRAVNRSSARGGSARPQDASRRPANRIIKPFEMTGIKYFFDSTQHSSLIDSTRLLPVVCGQLPSLVVMRASTGDARNSNSRGERLWPSDQCPMHSFAYYEVQCAGVINNQVAACEWASTNHSHLSNPREISVKISAVSASSN